MNTMNIFLSSDKSHKLTLVTHCPLTYSWIVFSRVSKICPHENIGLEGFTPIASVSCFNTRLLVHSLEEFEGNLCSFP